MTRAMALDEITKKVAEKHAKMQQQHGKSETVLECDRHTHAITTHRLLTDEAITTSPNTSNASIDTRACAAVCDRRTSQYATRVTVPEAIDNRTDHTKYKVIIEAIPHNALQNDPQRFVAWTRYRDLWRLYQQLVTVNTQLRLRGQLPHFPKPTMFGKHEPDVIAERRRCAEAYLAYALENEILSCCTPMVQFLETFELEPDEALYSGELMPTLVPERVRLFEDPLIESLTTNDAESSDNAMISAKHPEEPTERQRQRSSSLSSSDSETSEVDRTFNEATTSAAIEIPVSADRSSEQLDWLSSSMDRLRAMQKSTASPASSLSKTPPSFTIEDTSVELPSTANALETSLSQSQHAQTNASLKSKISKFFPKLTKREDGRRTSTESANAFENTTARQNAPLPKPDLYSATTSEDYLVQAAQYIHCAQQAERDRMWELAFSCYKNAVNLMLHGIQDDQNSSHAQAVSKKTAQCLLRAEVIYRTHLCFDNDESKIDLERWSKEVVAPAVHDAALLALRGNATQLTSNFTIVGVIARSVRGNVLLVQCNGTGKKFVLKLLDKTCHYRSKGANVVPLDVARMTHLVKFYELPNHIALLLEYHEHGRLIDFLSDYIVHRTREYKQRLLLAEVLGVSLPSSYAGAHSHFHVKSDEDVEEPQLEVPALDALDYGNKLRDDDGTVLKRLSADIEADTSPRRTKSTSVPVLSEMSLHDAMTTVRERLRNKERWSKECPLAIVLIRHWIADIVLALESLHKCALVIGDLNWRNVLLDTNGRVVLTHQCAWACNDAYAPHKMLRLMYAPPEALSVAFMHQREPAADWWSLGALLYELLNGVPLRVAHAHALTMTTQLYWNEGVDEFGRNLVEKLLQIQPASRLGTLLEGAADVKRHPFFEGVDWED